MWSSVSVPSLSHISGLVMTLTRGADKPRQLSASAARPRPCTFVWSCQNAENFNVTASLNVTGLRQCRIHLRTVNRIQLALLMWSSVKDRFPPSQFIQTCFRTVYILHSGNPNCMSTGISADMKKLRAFFFHLAQTQT